MLLLLVVVNDDDDVDKMVVVVAHTPHLSVRTPHLSVRTSRLLCLLFGGTVRKNGAKKKNCYHDNDADYSDGDDDEREDSQGTVSTHSPIIILLLTHHHHHHHHPIHPSISIIIIIHLKIYMLLSGGVHQRGDINILLCGDPGTYCTHPFSTY